MLCGGKPTKSFDLFARIAVYAPNLGQGLTSGLTYIKNIRSTKARDDRRVRCALVRALRLAAQHRSENHDAFLSLLDEASELIPRAEARDMTGVGFLQGDEQNVMQTECELPDYVNWRKKSKAARIILCSKLNIVRAISRTSAICAG
jgi:hypothetical protein